MPNNPVQIVLNDSDFHQAPDPGQPPRPKDFFEGRDAEFVRHKAGLLAALDAVTDEIGKSPYGPAAYLKVEMRNEAVAKSYRPVGRLFKPDQFPCVGADAVGTLYFRAPLIYLAGLRQRIEAAEIEVAIKVRREDGEPYKAPTQARAEVGAIETLVIAPPEGKRGFATAAAIAAFADPRTVSGYHVELFETPDDHVIARDPLGQAALQRSLARLLLSFGQGARSYVASAIGRTPVLEVQLTRAEHPALLDNRAGLGVTDVVPSPPPAAVDDDPRRHDAVLLALQNHPLVRAILPPVRLQVADEAVGSPPAAKPFAIPAPVDGATYPLVGVIDTGVAPVLDDWLVGRFDYLKADEIDPKHGTEVAGLITLGPLLNDPAITPETHGCRIYDAALFPKTRFLDKYRRGFTDFLEELEQAVAEARDTHGVRVFNLSINAESDVERHRYSIYASRLDQISDTYGVIFVNSAGNLPASQVRAPWPKKPSEVKNYFAARQSPDTIQKPCESVRSVAAGALNPPGTEHIAGAPTTYSMRGPGLQVGVKPDVAAYGGAGTKATGLNSIGPDGAPCNVRGTSYSAPLVARALAGLDVATEGGLAPETLRALLLHCATMPEPLLKRGLKELARQFAGFGQPVSVAEMLETGDHQITLLFQSRLSIGVRKPVILRFPFTWPQSLVVNGACFGRARITLVYAPPLDPAFGAEFVRVNLDASLAQLQPEPDKNGKPRYLNQITPRYMPKKAGLAIPEKALIDQGLKWWPAKQYEDTFTENGSSPQWRLEVTSVVRAEAVFPAEGVPFAVLLTLEDPEGKKPVFQEMRQQLQASPANAVDVRTAVRLRQRG
jgi:hypothetical protein